MTDYQPDPAVPAAAGWCEAVTRDGRYCHTRARYDRDGRRICGLHLRAGTLRFGPASSTPSPPGVDRRENRHSNRRPVLVVEVGVWVVTFGTARVYTAAPSAADAERWFRGYVLDKRGQGAEGFVQRVHFCVSPATAKDLADLVDAGAVPAWMAGAHEVRPAPTVVEPQLLP